MYKPSAIHFKAYHDQPDLPALVLLHGAGGSYLSWPPHIRRMPGCRVFAVDLPGHGASPALDEVSILSYAGAVTAWMRATGLKTAFLAGHSMGSAIALQIALEHPELVRGLCLVGSAARLGVHPAILEYTAAPDTYHKAVELVIHWSFGSGADTGLQLLTTRRMAETSPAVLQADFEACNHFDITSRLDQINCPTLLITGEEDRMTPLDGARFLAAHIPTARLKIIPQVGHFAMQEAPQAVLSAMSDFIQDVILL